MEFVVDDFGVAYSSLTYLKLLPVTAVKIDRSFVEAVTEDLADESIVRAITAACHATGRYTVAEGVQRPDQLRLLQSLGVEVVQGDLVGVPAPLAVYAELIARGGLDFEASGTLDAGLW